MKARIFPLLVSLSLVSTACQSNPFAQKSVIPSLSTAPTQATTQASSSVVPAPKGSLPPPQTYDLQVNEDQVVARLTKITFTEDSIIIDLAFTNVSREAIQLNAKDDMKLYDDTHDNTYRLSVPPDNPTIQIQPGTTLKGQFVFIGRIPPNATNLTLTTNSSLYSSNKNFPHIHFNNMLIQR